MPPPGSNIPRSVRHILSAFLERYDLTSLLEWAWRRYKGLGGGETALGVIGVEIRDQPKFKARFPGLAAREANGLPAISVEDYLAVETSYKSTMRRFGVPASFFDRPGDFVDLFRADVGTPELEQRLGDGYSKVINSPAAREYFGKYFGAQGDGALLAAFLKPSEALPKLLQEAQAATIGGIGATVGGFDVSKETALRAAQLGISEAQAAGAFSDLGASRELFGETVSESTDLDIGTQGVGAALGTDAEATAAVRKRQQERQAAFGGGGGAAATQRGVVGLGSART